MSVSAVRTLLLDFLAAGETSRINGATESDSQAESLRVMRSEVVAIVIALAGCLLSPRGVHAEQSQHERTVSGLDAEVELIDRITVERDELTARLQLVVLDDNRLPGDRADAASMLARLGSDRAIRFLLDNLDLRVPRRSLGSDRDRMEHEPCLYALGEASWQAVPIIMEYLQEPQARERIRELSFVLATLPGRDAAVCLLRERLQRRPVSNAVKETLTLLIERLE